MTRIRTCVVLCLALSCLVVRLDSQNSLPDPPVLMWPAADAAGVPLNPSLTVEVSNAAGGALTTQYSLRRVAGEEFTIIALPDTQHYSQRYPEIFTAQTQWIVDNRDALNIVFVSHEGDLVQDASADAEWKNADASMRLLDNAGIPYGVAPGDHDQPATKYNQYFGVNRFAGKVYYGGSFQTNNDNNYQLFTAGGMDFVIVHLDYCPSTAAVSWAAGIFSTFPEHVGILTTHGYMDGSANRKAGACRTQYLWDQLAVPSQNLRFMLAGHISGESRRTDSLRGRTVHQMMADYEERSSGGQGFLRILRFVPAEGKVYVQAYSPWLNKFETDADSQLTLGFDMGSSFEEIGGVTLQSDGVASFPATSGGDLLPYTTYEWRVTVNNSNNKIRQSPNWRFTTGGDTGAVNRAPTAVPSTATVPEDGGTLITLTGTDPEGSPLTYWVSSLPVNGTLSGSAPNLIYHPSPDFNGTDNFLFWVHDGEKFSQSARVWIAVQLVNDQPVATADLYSVGFESTLSVSRPGFLANDTDVDGGTLTAVLGSGPSHGTLTMRRDGSFNYTPAGGYSGPDAFTYKAFDGAMPSELVTVNLAVAGPPPVVDAHFDSGSDSFSYSDNRFRRGNQASYASGSRIASGGVAGGALQVVLGGKDDRAIAGISGGFRRSFKMTSAGPATLRLRFNMNTGSDFESNEISEVLVAVDDVLKAIAPNDFLARITGDGNGGVALGTGWQEVTFPLGTLSKGSHTLTIGGYVNQKDSKTEVTTILFDDVTVSR